METRNINELTPNTLSIKMYGEFSLANESDYALFTSIRANGILEPIVINKNNVIVSGMRRFSIAQMIAKLQRVPVRIVDINEVSELDIIEYNLQRVKNDVQWAYELEVIRKELGSKQGVKLNDEGKAKLEKIKKQVSKNISDSTRKRVISAVKIQRELNPEKNESEIWAELNKEVENGVKVNTLLKNLEQRKAKEINAEKAKEYSDFQHECFKIIEGDSRDIAKQIEDNSIDCLASSPPYWSFRVYSKNDDIEQGRERALGEESTDDEYINNLVEIISNYKSKLKDSSSVFINVMDKVYKNRTCKIPFKLIFKLEEKGFTFLQNIVWFKRNPQPMVNRNMFQTSCEYILHFVIDIEKYYWDYDWMSNIDGRFINPALHGEDGKMPLIRNVIIPPPNEFKDGDFVTEGLISMTSLNKNALNSLLEKKGFTLTHTALYSYEVPMLCILPTTKTNDICLDIFSGLGTTGIVAYATDRNYIGVEKSNEYASQSKARFIELFKIKHPEDFV